MNSILAAASIGSWMDTTFYDFDMSLFKAFGSIGCDFLNWVAKAFTTMGAVTYIVLFALIGVALIFFKRTRRLGFAIVFAVIIGTIITNVIVKPMFLRIRPYNTLQHIQEYFGWYTNAGMLSENDYSFPSGHTTAAMEIAMALCLCHARDGKKKIAWIFPVIALLTGCSRIYLMVHYASDVIGGVIIGVIAGVAGYALSCLVVNKLNPDKGLSQIDLEQVFCSKRYGRMTAGQVVPALTCTWLIIYLVVFIPLISPKEEVLRCAYNVDYQCYNEAKTGDKYAPIDGKYYCKQHYSQAKEDYENAASTQDQTTVTEVQTTAADTANVQAETQTETAAAN
jgi:undecaprenyl-diphosphatase